MEPPNRGHITESEALSLSQRFHCKCLPGLDLWTGGPGGTRLADPIYSEQYCQHMVEFNYVPDSPSGLLLADSRLDKRA